MKLFSRKGKIEKRSQDIDHNNNTPSIEIPLNFQRFFTRWDALSISAVFAAIEMISNALAVLPIKVSQKIDGGKEEMYDHPFIYALNHMQHSKYILIKKMITDMLMYGNGYCYIKRAKDGSVKELVYCESGDVSIIWNKVNHSLYYLCPYVAKGRIEPVNMIHFYKNTKDGYQGIGILQYADEVINLAGVTNESAENFFSSGCNVNGILTYTGPLSDKQKKEIRDNWAATHSGNNPSGVAVLPGGMTYATTGSSANDSQLLESRTFNITEIARFFNISPTLIGELSHSSYNTIEAAQQAFVLHTLMSYINMIESEFNRKVLKPSEKELVIDLDESYLLRADKSATASYYNTLVNDGVLSINEVRAALGYAPIEGGDNHIIAYTKISDNIVGEDNKNGEKE